MGEECRALHDEAEKNHDPADQTTLDARRAGSAALAALFFDPVAQDTATGAPSAKPGKVVVDGRTVVDGGLLVSGDIEAVRAHAREQATRLWARMAALGD
jgi:hypothetical protein